MRRLWLKIAGTALLTICAALLAVHTAHTFPGQERTEPRSYDGAAAAYVLRDYEGYVCVFAPDEDPQPLQITSIPTSSLRDRDRDMLRSGLTVGSREQLLMLLEDLSE